MGYEFLTAPHCNGHDYFTAYLYFCLLEMHFNFVYAIGTLQTDVAG